MTINRTKYLSSRNKIEQKRLRLRDWLEMRIDNPRYPGLEWVNREEKIFRIPWKHGARHGWREAIDARLFQEWSEHTGASPRDVKQHKANFRCALNSLRDIIQVHKLNKQKGEDAYRVYKMLPKKNQKSTKEWIGKRQPKSPSDCLKNKRLPSTSNEHLIPPCSSNLTTSQSPPSHLEQMASTPISIPSSSFQPFHDTPKYSNCHNSMTELSVTYPCPPNDCYLCSPLSEDDRTINTPNDSFEGIPPVIELQNRSESSIWGGTCLQGVDGENVSYSDVSFAAQESMQMPYEQSFHPITLPTFNNTSAWGSNVSPVQNEDLLNDIVSTQRSSTTYENLCNTPLQLNYTSMTSAPLDQLNTGYLSPPEQSLLCLSGGYENQCFNEQFSTTPSDFCSDNENNFEKSFSFSEIDATRASGDSNQQLLSENDMDDFSMALSSAASGGRLPSASTLLSHWFTDSSGPQHSTEFQATLLC